MHDLLYENAQVCPVKKANNINRKKYWGLGAIQIPLAQAHLPNRRSPISLFPASKVISGVCLSADLSPESVVHLSAMLLIAFEL
jgi:hypothetical protein